MQASKTVDNIKAFSFKDIVNIVMLRTTDWKKSFKALQTLKARKWIGFKMTKCS
jgi:hypothetical protein